MSRNRRLNSLFLMAAVLSLLLATVGRADHKPADSLAKNPGFEAGLDDWSVHVYGAKPTVALDRAVFHEGRQALRISAASPSDTAAGQDIRLKPRQLYRFSGWVRTERLDPHGAPVFGTFQIQQPGGRGIIASGTNHRGDTDWTEVVMYFAAPPNGQARIAVFFVGFGQGTGTAWFDDLKLEEVDASQLPLKITRDRLFASTIDPRQYGQFVEYLCDLIPSMWAEKLYDGSFEGLTPYKFYYLKETDFREQPWYPTGTTNRAYFSLDPVNPVSGRVAQKIAVKDGPPCTVGIAQNGLAVGPDQNCVFSCFLRQEGIQGPVTVRVHREGVEYAACEFSPTGDWKKYRAPLAFSRADSRATLSITFRGPGTLWLDNVSLMPEKTLGGWRTDVVEAVRALKPGVIRFGGSIWTTAIWVNLTGATRSAIRTSASHFAPGAAYSRPAPDSKKSSNSVGQWELSRSFVCACPRSLPKMLPMRWNTSMAELRRRWGNCGHAMAMPNRITSNSGRSAMNGPGRSMKPACPFSARR